MNRVYFVGAGPGDPELITVRGKELLLQAELLIYTGSLVHPNLIAVSPAQEKYDSHGMRLEEIVAMIARAAKAGKRVVRLHSGDPSLYGAIVEQIAELERQEVEVEIVPGVSSMFAAAAALKTQLTLSGVSDTLVVTRPSGRTLEKDTISEFSRSGVTMVVFLGADKLEEVAAKASCSPDTPAAVVYRASWPDQKIVRGPLSEIAHLARKAGIERTALLIVGGVVDPTRSGFRRSVLYS